MVYRRVVGLLLVLSQTAGLTPMHIYGEFRERSPVSISEASVSGVLGPLGGELSLGSVRLEVPAGSLAAETEIRITKLAQVAQMCGGLHNVTRGGGGYRFEPAGLQFRTAVTVRLPYDERL
ncbi:MAG: hypothetical protein FWD36_10125, partial [Treponema sp.]|nr:hypothetical protein [Treponema sp.]